jgi:prepilin-type N-terminal cleavage/methylation domain-containing protein
MMTHSTNKKAFSIIELMIVVAIISILAMISFPSYQNYVKKARFVELINAAQPFKLAITLALQKGIPIEQIKNDYEDLPDPPRPNSNLASLSIDKGIITAVGTPLLENITYILKPDTHGIHWQTSGTCVKQRLCKDDA